VLERRFAMTPEQELFQARVLALIEQFERDVDKEEWVTKRYLKTVRDSAKMVVPVWSLRLQKGATLLLLDPVGYDVPGAEAAVDLYLMPRYDDIASLFFEGGQWVFNYVFPADPRETSSVIPTETLPVTKESINKVLDTIAEHATP
jgi:hypothetical protein